MSGAVAALVLACLVVPAAWGWLLDAAFRRLGLARFFPLQDLEPRPGPVLRDYQI